MSTSRFDLASLRDRDELRAVGKEVGAEIKEDDVSSLAAAVSFKIVLALFPAMLAAVAIFALVIEPRDLQNLLGNLPDNVTAVVQDQLEDFIAAAASGGIAIGGIAAGLWAASGAAATLNKALTRAYDEQEGRKIVGQRGTAFAVTVALLVALIAISILLVAGGSIENRILESLPLADAARLGLDTASTVGRYLVAILLLMILFAFIYWIGPDYGQRPSYRWISPGAFIAVLVWLLASAGFGWYVSTFGSYTDEGSVYGPLGNAIVFMLWLQLSMFALLLGAEINQVLARRARRRAGSGEAVGAGSIGADERGAPPVPAGSAPRTAPSSDGDDEPSAGTSPRAAAGALRAATTPTGGRRGARRGRRPAAGDGHLADGGAQRAVNGARGRVDVRMHRGSANSAQPSHAAAAHGPDGGRRDGDEVPTATLVGAGVAAASSLVGVVGLLRRLRG